MDRTHSIMRIATTASPISGADVRQRMEHLRLLKKVEHSVHVISTNYLAYKERKEKKKNEQTSKVLEGPGDDREPASVENDEKDQATT